MAEHLRIPESISEDDSGALFPELQPLGRLISSPDWIEVLQQQQVNMAQSTRGIIWEPSRDWGIKWKLGIWNQWRIKWTQEVPFFPVGFENPSSLSSKYLGWEALITTGWGYLTTTSAQPGKPLHSSWSWHLFPTSTYWEEILPYQLSPGGSLFSFTGGVFLTLLRGTWHSGLEKPNAPPHVAQQGAMWTSVVLGKPRGFLKTMKIKLSLDP